MSRAAKSADVTSHRDAAKTAMVAAAKAADVPAAEAPEASHMAPAKASHVTAAEASHVTAAAKPPAPMTSAAMRPRRLNPARQDGNQHRRDRSKSEMTHGSTP